jgi:hypothetical protein
VANLTSPTSEAAPAAKFPDALKEEPKGSIVGLRATKFSSGLSTGASPEPKPRTASAAAPGNDGLVCPPKPKPLPKPRPWSIVGVDRKSGELTSVVGDSAAEPKTDAPLTSSAATSNVGRKSSVRDMINNMNKGDPSPSAPAASAAAVTDAGFRRKGGSLPRGVQPPQPASSSSAASSPSVAKKKDSTSDDPRILKLDDDFAFEDVMDV